LLEIQHVGDDKLRATHLPEIPVAPLRAVAAGYDPVEPRLVFFGDRFSPGWHAIRMQSA